jgi:hypothetical protein
MPVFSQSLGNLWLSIIISVRSGLQVCYRHGSKVEGGFSIFSGV